jgi:TolB-like protein
MGNQSWIEKFKERKVGRTLAVYLGSAWVFIEAFNFLIDHFNWNAAVLNIVILLVIFGLPASVIYVWFQQKFTKRAIFLQVINGLLAISVISFTLIRPDSINPTQLRLLKFKNNQQKLAEAIRSIAVLPFDNYTGDDSQDFLAFGMHDALISELGQLGAIRVVSKTSSLAYSDSEKTLKEIASELKVDAIIEASVLSVDENIRVQLKLISPFPEEQQLWSQTFNSDMSNILDLYNRVIKNIASEIRLTLSPEQQTQLAEKKEVNPESYKAYLRGMYNLNMDTPEATKRGMEYLQEAVRIDPADAFGYAGLALGYLEIAHGPLDPGDALNKAEAAANQAFRLDTTIAEIYSAMAELYLYSTWEFDKVEEYFKRALEINPNLDLTHYHYSWALYLFGRMDEAIEQHELAQKYDPLNPMHTAWLGGLYNSAGRYEDAVREALKSFEIQKDYAIGYLVLGDAYLGLGREEEAIKAHEKLAEVAPWWSSKLGVTYAKTNHRDEAEHILNELENSEINGFIAVGLAHLNAALGNTDEVFKWLNYEPHHGFVAYAAVNPLYEPYHNDVRWKEFLERLNLPK